MISGISHKKHFSLKGLSIILLFGAIFGCEPGNQADRNAVNFLQNVLTAEGSRLDSLSAELEETIFIQEDIPLMYQVLERPFADDQLGEESIRFRLFRRLAGMDHTEKVRFIEKVFPSLNQHAHLQAVALEVLTQEASEESLRAFVRILTQENPELDPYSMMAFGPLLESPGNLDKISREIPALIRQENYRPESLDLLYAGLESGSLTPDEVSNCTDLLIENYPNANPGEKEAVIRCLAYFTQNTEAQSLLSEAIEGKDAYLSLTAALAGLATGFPVDSSVWYRLAEEPGTRNQLYIRLESLDKLELFPGKFANQEAIAEGDLVMWLQSGDHNPGRIQPLGVVKLKGGDDEGKVYVFEFREEGKWFTGISGPQPTDSSQVVTTGYLTGSKFTSRERKTPEEIAVELME